MMAKKIRIVINTYDSLKSVRIPLIKRGGAIQPKKGRGSYNRRNKDWNK